MYFVLLLTLLYIQRLPAEPLFQSNNASLFIKDSLLFEVKNRPRMASAITTLHQPISLEELFALVQQHTTLSYYLNETCEMIMRHYVNDFAISHYTDAKEVGGIPVNRNTRELFTSTHRLVQPASLEQPLEKHEKRGLKFYNTVQTQLKKPLKMYEVINRTPQTEYDSVRACEKAGMMLPEPITDQEIADLSYFLMTKSLPETFLGVTFDIKTMQNRFTYKGHSVSAQNIPIMENRTMNYKGELINLELTRDDYETKFTLTNSRYLKIWTVPEEYRMFGKTNSDQPISSQSTKVHNSPHKAPIICEYIETVEERTKELKNKELEAKNSHEICQTAHTIVRETIENMLEEINKMLHQNGLIAANNERPKRQLANLATALIPAVSSAIPSIMTLFSPSTIKDTYTQYQKEKKFGLTESAIREQGRRLAEQAKHLKEIDIQVDDTIREQTYLKWAVQETRERVTVLEKYREIDQHILAIIALNQHLERSLDRLIDEINQMFREIQSGLIPQRLRPQIQEYLQGKGFTTSDIILQDHDPILVQKEVYNRTIHIYITFEEGQDIWDLFQITPLPIYVDGKQYRRYLTYNHVLVDKEQQHFAVISEQDSIDCMQTLCDKATIRREVLDDECGVICLVDKQADSNCPIVEEKVEPFFVNTEHGIAYTVPEETKARASCSDRNDIAGVDAEFTLKDVGIIHLPPGCDLIIKRPLVKMKGPLSPIYRSFTGVKNVYVNRNSDHIRMEIHKFPELLTQTAQETIWKAMKDKINTTGWMLIGTVTVLIILVIAIYIASGGSIYHLYKKLKQIALRTRDIKEKVETELETFNKMTKELNEAEKQKTRTEVNEDYIEMSRAVSLYDTPRRSTGGLYATHIPQSRPLRQILERQEVSPPPARNRRIEVRPTLHMVALCGEEEPLNTQPRN